MKKVLVVTTINGTSHQGISRLIDDSHSQDFELVLIGDEKTPSNLCANPDPKLHFYDLGSQLSSQFLSGRALPLGHYARKNFGYLIAADMGCSWISETDDDNRLYNGYWQTQLPTKSIKNSGTSKWVNIYNPFGFDQYWHRGIPIDEVQNSNSLSIIEADASAKIACVQGLADGDPDVDAICRMLYSPVTRFSTKNSFLVEPGYYCPTNSQMTRWNTKLTLQLLYLPSTVPWRVSDIWRGLIAQRYFEISGLSTQFRGGLGYQDRNQHDLIKDFIDEIEVHKSSRALLNILEGIHTLDKSEFICAVYREMLAQKLVLEDELLRLDAWLFDTSTILKGD